ncbi:MAG: hypothetical protein NTX97_05525, partial [Bacteroidetes bacterium]|nr:hypothetical protein [Bacteroidota bacterium]
MKNSLKKIFVFTILSIIILLMSYCGNPTKDERTETNSGSGDQYLNHNDTAHYVGMSKCKLCHQAIYNSFIETGMGKSF